MSSSWKAEAGAAGDIKATRPDINSNTADIESTDNRGSHHDGIRKAITEQQKNELFDSPVLGSAPNYSRVLPHSLKTVSRRLRKTWLPAILCIISQTFHRGVRKARASQMRIMHARHRGLEICLFIHFLPPSDGRFSNNGLALTN